MYHWTIYREAESMYHWRCWETVPLRKRMSKKAYIWWLINKSYNEGMDDVVILSHKSYA